MLRPSASSTSRIVSRSCVPPASRSTWRAAITSAILVPRSRAIRQRAPSASAAATFGDSLGESHERIHGDNTIAGGANDERVDLRFDDVAARRQTGERHDSFRQRVEVTGGEAAIARERLQRYYLGNHLVRRLDI